MKLFISGLPGCGKTTLILELINELKASKKIAGIVTPELKDGVRKGFLIKDLASKKQAVLASVNQKEGPKVSKYRVNVKGIDEVVQEAEKSFDQADVIIIDEIGKMELFSKTFECMLAKLLASNKTVIATVHRAYAAKFRDKGNFVWLEKGKRETVKKEILKLIKQKC